ncbi:cytochrome c oxidase subunit 6B1-like [Sycon ciliatum]|uniref:cytochrome c oxidase subunit 6B1-like n=1 Tax=Sycon ciliatum TaxID=27933 RepID=UPI0020A9C675|eukprot:scpid93835/ scgid28697/ Cytochrome c oxidase subunit 6B1; Cytochrome c oxidase subunit VIb isoform 1
MAANTAAETKPDYSKPENHGLFPEEERPSKQDPKAVKFLQAALPMSPPPFDRRFPQQNVTGQCHQNYLDFLRCSKKLGEGHQSCKWYETEYKFTCPQSWVDSFEDQVQSGTFPFKI